ncbi:hypothetical protein ACIQPP_05695 [Streptomyces violaceusniger]|uniref:hypothetical protein n=1 Tax=Streptomyces violaceusniger TaxID=68280 RepID=UPI0009C30F71|nr:hypothetical protein [Streptomyces hygroscopicus]AQW55313.1 hypothetical protein SHXM_08776 [Streptomyces hygroscopicus]
MIKAFTCYGCRRPTDRVSPITEDAGTGPGPTRFVCDECKPPQPARVVPLKRIDPTAPDLPPLTAGLIARINVRTWLDHTADDNVFSVMMLTYPAPQFEDVNAHAIERTMRGVAASLGAVPFGQPLPAVGARVVASGGEALVWFSGCPWALKLTHPRWVRTINKFGRVLLAVGLDELSPVASKSEVDEYIEGARQCGRMHVALADVGSSVREARRATLALPGGDR